MGAVLRVRSYRRTNVDIQGMPYAPTPYKACCQCYRPIEKDDGGNWRCRKRPEGKAFLGCTASSVSPYEHVPGVTVVSDTDDGIVFQYD